MKKITIISGTNRNGSQTLRVSTRLAQKYQVLGAQVNVLDLCKLPAEIFTPEAYSQKPAEFEPFSKAVLESDGLVVVTPEYNGSFPGVLKLFIDHLKFPESFEKRPVAFVGLAAGMWGALRSVEQLQLIFAYRNGFLFNERVFIPRVDSQIDENGEAKESLLRGLIDSQVKNFLEYVKSLENAVHR